MNIVRVAMIGFSAWLLAGCGGSSSSEPEATPAVGSFSLAVSDAPMNGVSHVGMVLNELVMTDQNGVIHRHDLEGVSFNLLDYQGMDSHLVVENINLPVGQYHGAYISVEPGNGNQGCYIENGQGRHGLAVAEGRLPVADFEIVANQEVDITLEIDLYRGISNENGQFRLNHRGMWSVNNRTMGHLLGEVDPQWIADCETTYAEQVSDEGYFYHLAYLYPADVTGIQQMGDMNPNPEAGITSPIAITRMKQDSEGHWFFTMGFLPEGNYRVGYTCLGHLDNPQDNDIKDGVFKIFKDSGEVAIEAGSVGGRQTTHQCGRGNGGHHGRRGG